jgi:hypothetical protein
MPMPAPPPAQKTPYDFFLKPHSATRNRRLPSPKKAGFRGKIIWLVGGAFAVMLIIGVISAVLPKNTSTLELTTIAQTQQEIVRICDKGGSKGTERSTRFYAVNCSAGITGDEQKLVEYLAKNGVKLKAKQLGLLASKTSDQKLDSALAASAFDPAFITLSQQQLNAYGAKLQSQLANPDTGPNAQAILKTAIDHDKLLLQQVKALAGSQ